MSLLPPASEQLDPAATLLQFGSVVDTRWAEVFKIVSNMGRTLPQLGLPNEKAGELAEHARIVRGAARLASQVLTGRIAGGIADWATRWQFAGPHVQAAPTVLDALNSLVGLVFSARAFTQVPSLASGASGELQVAKLVEFERSHWIEVDIQLDVLSGALGFGADSVGTPASLSFGASKPSEAKVSLPTQIEVPIDSKEVDLTSAASGEFIGLFVAELEASAPRLLELVLALERGEDIEETGEEAMRLCHSLKGAARIVGLNVVVGVLHAAEDTLTEAAAGKALGESAVRHLIELVDLLEQAATLAPTAAARWVEARAARWQLLETALRVTTPAGHIPIPKGKIPLATMLSGGNVGLSFPIQITPYSAQLPGQGVKGSDEFTHLGNVPVNLAGEQLPEPIGGMTAVVAAAAVQDIGPQSTANPSAGAGPRAQRVSAESLARILGLAGESVVQARRLGGSQRSLTALERTQRRLVERSIALVRLTAQSIDPNLATLAQSIAADAKQASQLAVEAMTATSEGLQRLLDVGERLYIESLLVRQRPFAQLVPSLRRQVRDGALALKKSAKLEISGHLILVDADVLVAMEPILQHLLTNALDHGLEPEAKRLALGKPAHGMLKIELRPTRAQLQLTLTDDGQGIDIEKLRGIVIERGLAPIDMARALDQSELYEFLFLPGFSTKDKLSVHSGRGVGLDAVRTDVSRLGGRISIQSQPGKYTRFELLLPVTRVVVRALLLRVAGEIYALPLARAGRVVRVPVADLRNAEGRDYIEMDGENVGVVRADELLELANLNEDDNETLSELTIVILGEDGARYGLVVDAALSEDDLLVRPLDPRLSRVPNVASTALLADGAPTLVLDVDDLIRSIEKLTRKQRPERAFRHVRPTVTKAGQRQDSKKVAKKVLIVDDSLTVREVERQLLAAKGYDVDVAVDGLDGWKALKERKYDLLVADVDMPRMNGLELVQRLRADVTLARLPVIIVSYKDRDEDRLRGLEVGADYYLAKSKFHDDQLVHAVRELIGEAT